MGRVHSRNERSGRRDRGIQTQDKFVPAQMTSEERRIGIQPRQAQRFIAEL